MGKMLKPKKPTCKKPVMPQEPFEPSRFKDNVWLGTLHRAAANLGKEDWWVDSEMGASLEIEVGSGDVFIHRPDPNYKRSMNKYQKDLDKWNKAMHPFKLALAEYDVVMAEYQVELSTWKQKEAKDSLDRAMEKLNG